jgi:general secretion pathway protein J
VSSRRESGFTLIEVLVAVAILAMVMTLVWGSFNGTFKTKQQVEAQAGRYRTVRIALERLAREVSQAFLSQNEDTSQPERRTLFVGKRKFDIDELRFSYFGHQRLYQDANECDTAQVSYYAGRDPRTNRPNLVRRETRRLTYLKLEEQAGEADIVCDDVVRLQLDYYDSRDKIWREEWVTNAADGQPDRLPSRVKITLTVRDERGQEVPFTTEARISMQEPLNLKAVDLQAGSFGGIQPTPNPNNQNPSTQNGPQTGNTGPNTSATGNQSGFLRPSK